MTKTFKQTIRYNIRRLLCFKIRIILKSHYVVEERGRECLKEPFAGAMLMLPSHRAIVDNILLFSSLGKYPMRAISFAPYFKIPIVRGLLRLFDAVPVPDVRDMKRNASFIMQLPNIVNQSLANGDVMLINPSGHITTDGSETIGNRQLAYDACKNLPANASVIGIRITGLWGSQWSRYNRDSTPSIVRLLAKAFLQLITLVLFFKGIRHVSIEYIDITADALEWSNLGRHEFNRKLEGFYQAAWPNGVEPPTVL